MRSGFDHKWHLSLFAQILTCSLDDPSCEKVENIVADSKRLSAQHKHQCRLVTIDHRVGKRYQLRRALRRFHISFHTLEERTEEAIRGVVRAYNLCLAKAPCDFGSARYCWELGVPYLGCPRVDFF